MGSGLPGNPAETGWDWWCSPVPRLCGVLFWDPFPCRVSAAFRKGTRPEGTCLSAPPGGVWIPELFPATASSCRSAESWVFCLEAAPHPKEGVSSWSCCFWPMLAPWECKPGTLVLRMGQCQCLLSLTSGTLCSFVGGQQEEGDSQERHRRSPGFLLSPQATSLYPPGHRV